MDALAVAVISKGSVPVVEERESQPAFEVAVNGCPVVPVAKILCGGGSPAPETVANEREDGETAKGCAVPITSVTGILSGLFSADAEDTVIDPL